MKRHIKWGIRECFCSSVGIGSLALVACHSSPIERTARGDTTPASVQDSGVHIETLCISDRISNPTEPIHYSYKYSGVSDSIDNEADITPKVMDITSNDSSGSHTYHGDRSDENSWNAAVLDLSSLRFTGLSARIDSVNGTSALVPQGADSVNGYKTSKYAIDTTRAKASDQQQFETLFGKGSFEKGTIWVSSDGCAVKLVLDEAIVQNDASVDKGHYELAIVRK